jgi:hypothetical protein
MPFSACFFFLPGAFKAATFGTVFAREARLAKKPPGLSGDEVLSLSSSVKSAGQRSSSKAAIASACSCTSSVPDPSADLRRFEFISCDLVDI